MVLKFLGIFLKKAPPNFMDFFISFSHPLQLLFRITMPEVPENYENHDHGNQLPTFQIQEGYKLPQLVIAS